MNIEMPSMPEIKKEHLPYAYGIIAIGALIIVKKPSLLLNIASAYFTWRNMVELGKTKLDLY